MSFSVSTEPSLTTASAETGERPGAPLQSAKENLLQRSETESPHCRYWLYLWDFGTWVLEESAPPGRQEHLTGQGLNWNKSLSLPHKPPSLPSPWGTFSLCCAVLRYTISLSSTKHGMGRSKILEDKLAWINYAKERKRRAKRTEARVYMCLGRRRVYACTGRMAPAGKHRRGEARIVRVP